MKVLVTSLATLVLFGCHSISVEPNKMGAQQECAHHSASLSQYNDCTEHVDSFYREYEQEKKTPEKDDG